MAEPEVTVQERKELPKNFTPAESEEAIYKWWEESGFFTPPADASGEPFVISMPPPNVTGRLHMGHAMFVALQDIMTRYARMAGKNTLWLPGTDHAGIATQTVVEKQLTREGTSRLALGREAFLEKVWQWKQEYGGYITNQLRRLGASCDWSRERFTLDEGLSKAVAEAFVRLHQKGLVYRGSYMVNWSPALGTAVSDLEVEYSEEPGYLYYFKYPIRGSDGEYLTVATTRPETILGDTAVAVHPEDARYKQYVGRECEVPMCGRSIPIIADTYVDMEFGTGALKITPGHDPNDYELGKKHNLPLVNIMNKDATMNPNAGKYQGLDRFKAREQLWKDLEDAGLAIKKEPYTLRVPRSQRGGEVVEPLVSEQWFVRAEPLAKPALEAVRSGSIKIMPERFEKIYNFWLENIKDWCISRQLWWGHRIPVWYVFDSEEAFKTSEDGRSNTYVVARSEEEAYQLAREQYGPDVVLNQEEDVLDTWFSSSLWPFSTLGWPNEGALDLEKYYPTQVMETGHDILFFWVARMIMMGLEFTGRAPFHTVYLHGLVRDDKGRKMSKSLGNVIDPLTVIQDYGTDALRFTLVTGTSVGQDLNLSLDRVNANRNFTNKLWNAGKYILFNLEKVSGQEWKSLASVDYSSEEAVKKLPLAERWIVSSLHQLSKRVTECQENFDFSDAGNQLYQFMWGEFADWYIETSKARLYGADAGAAATSRAVLVYCFDRLLKLLHPFMPFITEELWQALPHEGPSLMLAAWPASSYVDSTAIHQFETLKDIVRSIRNLRAEYSVEPARKVAGSIFIDNEELRMAMNEELQVIALLAKLEASKASVLPGAEATHDGGASGSISSVVREGVEVQLPLAGLFDVNKELARLTKQKAKIEKELSSISARLKNPKFLEKASEEVVAETKQQVVEAEEKLAMLEKKFEQVSSLQ